MSVKTKNISTKNIALIVIALLVFISAPLYEKISKNYIDNSLKGAIVTYAVLRGINAGVSVIQKSSLTLGVGIEGNIAIGEALDPINDAVERFSDLITLSLWVLGSEKALYEISKTPPMIIFAILLSVSLLFFDYPIVKKLLIILIILRLFIPFSAAVSYYFDTNLFNPKIEKNIKILTFEAKTPLQQKNISQNNKGFLSELKSNLTAAQNSYEKLKESIDFYIKNSSKIISAIIDLSLLYFGKYMINLIFLPLLFVYLIKNIPLEKGS